MSIPAPSTERFQLAESIACCYPADPGLAAVLPNTGTIEALMH
jgi:hypothetical protein